MTRWRVTFKNEGSSYDIREVDFYAPDRDFREACRRAPIAIDLEGHSSDLAEITKLERLT
jgi:hypothetical protein